MRTYLYTYMDFPYSSAYNSFDLYLVLFIFFRHILLPLLLLNINTITAAAAATQKSNSCLSSEVMAGTIRAKHTTVGQIEDQARTKKYI